MRGVSSLPMFATLVLTGCVNVVGAPASSDDASSAATSATPRTPAPGDAQPPDAAPPDAPPPDAPPPDAPPPDEQPTDEQPSDVTSPDEPPPDDSAADQPPAGADPDGDGVVDAGSPGPPPATAGQSCSEWTDCGPHFADPNSGFDCVSGTCTCDDTGQWALACADIGGSWSAAECFCFTNTDTVMPLAAPEPPSGTDDDVTCWWTWRLRSCDPDEWIDTSYWERVCDGDECWDEYVERGYWEDGQCYGRWIKRCTDGNEYWY